MISTGRWLLVIWLALMALALGACVPWRSDKPDPCDEGGALLSDDFEGRQECGWVEYSRSGVAATIRDGVLQISTGQPGQIWWTNAGRNFDDVIITAETRLVEGPEDNAFGLICRYQSRENFYLFLISSDGYYAIGKYLSGSSQVEYLSGEGQYQFSDVINQGSATNLIRAACIGDELSLFVNGIPLASVNDPTFVTGDVGLGASTFQPGTAVVQFDNFQAIAP